MLNINLIRERLEGKTFINEIYYRAEIDSTSSFAKQSPRDNLLVLADYQTKGKGRYDRNWESEKGSNLMFSVKKKFSIKNSETPYINFYFTYHIYCAIKSYLEKNNIDELPLYIKWPNDILIDEKKVVGILFMRRERARLPWRGS